MQFETPAPGGLLAKLKWLLFGGRGHHWMYDGRYNNYPRARVPTLTQS